jgi:hypothetical protein
MIVLDEQLLGRGIETEISRWYQGAVKFIIDLRPNTVIKDDVIPTVLSQQNAPTFITINERDFWRKVKINSGFCVVWVTLSDARATEIPEVLRCSVTPNSRRRPVAWEKSFELQKTKSATIRSTINRSGN